jgi:hypothetical protein
MGVGSRVEGKTLKTLLPYPALLLRITVFLKRGDVKFIQGDFLQLNQGDLDPIDAIYDRAAMIALPQQMR